MEIHDPWLRKKYDCGGLTGGCDHFLYRNLNPFLRITSTIAIIATILATRIEQQSSQTPPPKQRVTTILGSRSTKYNTIVTIETILTHADNMSKR
mmetsp:Transcript_31750/g.35578  ORF Transcript_31750/g.35578 Transcript_31750/m.35578 type:complete len:95 (+) Transcript_31750:958-1242(+)